MHNKGYQILLLFFAKELFETIENKAKQFSHFYFVTHCTLSIL